MTWLYRSMKENQEGLPELGTTSRYLGIRPEYDVSAARPGDTVMPGDHGLSVSPDDPRNLPARRRPPWLGGDSKDAIWVIHDGELGPDLRYCPDPDRLTHGFIEVSRPMTLAEYQQALARTQCLWRKLQPPT